MIGRQICSSRSLSSSDSSAYRFGARSSSSSRAVGVRSRVSRRSAVSPAAGRSVGCSARCWRARRVAAFGHPLRVVEQPCRLRDDDPAVLVGLHRQLVRLPSGPPPGCLPGSRRTPTNPGHPGAPPGRGAGCPPARCRGGQYRSRTVRRGGPPARVDSSQPPRRMSIPRPAIWVDTVTVPVRARLGDDGGLLGVVLGVEDHAPPGIPWRSASARASDSALHWVPTSTG